MNTIDASDKAVLIGIGMTIAGFLLMFVIIFTAVGYMNHQDGQNIKACVQSGQQWRPIAADESRPGFECVQ